MPVLTPFFILFDDGCPGGCPGSIGFKMFWLAVLESALVYRALPGLLERAGLERSGEDMVMIEERVQRALVKYREH